LGQFPNSAKMAGAVESSKTGYYAFICNSPSH